MKTTFLFLSLFFLASGVSGDVPALAEIVVNRKNAIPSELTAAMELKTFLEKATGRTFPIRDESEKGASDAFYVGHTAFAAENNLTSNSFGREEWLVKTVGKSVVITGGRPRGTLYGVYEFLEKQYGVRFLAPDTTIVPETQTAEPDPKLFLRGKPFMEQRYVMRGGPGPKEGDYGAFLARSRNNDRVKTNRHGGGFEFGSPGFCHTFYAYSKDFPKDKPEYFSWRNGSFLRAVSDAGPGQLCLSKPQVRELIWEKLQSFIAADRKKNPDFPPSIYVVTGNDNNLYCQCAECMKFVREHGNYTDLTINFINDLAARLKKVHPELSLMTMAYTFTVPPPEKERPLDNVIIQIANLGKEFNGGTSETLFSIVSTQNEAFRKTFLAWRKIAKTIFVWDYWILYGKGFHYPCFNTERFFSDMRFFAENNVRGILIETQYQRSPFFALRGYLASRLAMDPFQNGETLLDEFFHGYYGAGAQPMRDYLALVEKNVRNEKKSIALTAPYHIGYLTNDFFDAADRLLDEAEKRCGNDIRSLEHVQMERIPVDYARLKLNAAGKSKSKIIARLERNLGILFAKYAYHAAPRYQKERSDVENSIQVFRLDIRPPREFEGRNITDFIWIDLPVRNRRNIVLTDDPAACGGHAVRMGEPADARTQTHTLPFIIGLYDSAVRKRGPELALLEFPQDGKYHLYKIGTYDVKADVALHALRTSDFWMPLARAYPNSPENICDVYASLKFAGPLYVKGSKEENAVFIDRVIVVKKE
ncbi:MAG: hypothetical protein BWY31_00713 [Lentisphaerae bacterium ADurb.Bin242]|nr:MAG: hypothetical protein BWY31_00713 [Lentisphaerae bacterium ADurb.Bin242]